MDWISLVTLLINCLLRVELEDQAIYYAQNLIAYIGKAQREGLIPTYLAVVIVLGLESLYVRPKIDLVAKAKSFKLPQVFLDSLELFLLSPKNISTDAIDEKQILRIFLDTNKLNSGYSIVGVCDFMTNRKLNHLLIISSMSKPSSDNLNINLTEKLINGFNDMLSNLNASDLPKKIAFTSNLGIIQYLNNKTQDSFTNLKIVKDMIENPEKYGYTSNSAKLKSTDILDLMNNLAVFKYL